MQATVWSNGVKALKSFGLEPMQYAGKMDRMAYLKHDTGEPLCDFALDPLYEKVCGTGQLRPVSHHSCIVCRSRSELVQLRELICKRSFMTVRGMTV